MEHSETSGGGRGHIFGTFFRDDFPAHTPLLKLIFQTLGPVLDDEGNISLVDSNI